MLRFPATAAMLTYAALVGCASSPDPVADSKIRTFPFGATSQALTLGAGDVLSIRVLARPERSSGPNHIRIGAQGFLHLPMVEAVQASGLLVGELRLRLTTAYAVYLRITDVSVNLVENNSQLYYLLGHVESPGAKLLDRSLTALETTTAGGHFWRVADRAHVFLLRPQEGGLESLGYDLQRPGRMRSCACAPST
jgi:protein involved in polysaccharide export with SLBB domain